MSASCLVSAMRPVPAASRQDIEDYLLDRVLPAAYAPRPGEVPPRYRLQAAQLALGYVAARMSQAGTRDLAWWRIAGWVPAIPRVIATGLVFGCMFCSAAALCSGPARADSRARGRGWRTCSGAKSAQIPGADGAAAVAASVQPLIVLVNGLAFALAGALFGGVIFWLAVGSGPGCTVGLVAAIGAGLAGVARRRAVPAGGRRHESPDPACILAA